ncbi:alginate O-acetyltransferase AlgX-related protein [Paenibacillus sp. 2003]|uniref:alginate O-acetyltransferase AlgX-related protein n=1 Tax=Paenibacillus sp. 2003 TaxID=2817761 RepID=UPI002866AC5A|nr:hypothetical protein [Paenibacillus sp. 2003]MDR6720360.1 hypothetical protein [Paenibacillus sp. 2003]
MKQRYRFINVCLLIAFIIIISIPLLAVNKTGGEISSSENRVLASFPSFTLNGGLNTQFISQFENWFSDNLGLRDKLVIANTKIQYNMFGEITRDNVILGKNNWLYLMYPNMVKAYQNLDLLTQTDSELYKIRFSQLKGYLNEENIPFITMINPNKETIYPEYMPDSIVKTNNPPRTDKVIEILRRELNIDIFNPKSALVKGKENGVVYSQNYDLTHWNSKGSFIGYTELMNHVKAYYPDVKILKEKDFDIEMTNRESMLYGAIPFNETDYIYNYKKEYSATEDTKTVSSMDFSKNNNVFRYVNNSDNDLPKALILGDSYIYMSMLPFLSESFSELTFIHWNNMDQIKNYISAFQPDVFILEFLEPALDDYVKNINYNEGYFDSAKDFRTLPVTKKPSKDLMWLDSINNEVANVENIVSINSDEPIAHLIGWALDPQAGTTANNIYLKVGNKYYSGNYGTVRESVSNYFQNNNLINSGFTFDISTKELLSAGKFNFEIISKDKTYKYVTNEYKISPK